jgi:hypothetical protein
MQTFAFFKTFFPFQLLWFLLALGSKKMQAGISGKLALLIQRIFRRRLHGRIGFVAQKTI